MRVALTWAPPEPLTLVRGSPAGDSSRRKPALAQFAKPPAAQRKHKPEPTFRTYPRARHSALFAPGSADFSPAVGLTALHQTKLRVHFKGCLGGGSTCNSRIRNPALDLPHIPDLARLAQSGERKKKKKEKKRRKRGIKKSKKAQISRLRLLPFRYSSDGRPPVVKRPNSWAQSSSREILLTIHLAGQSNVEPRYQQHTPSGKRNPPWRPPGRPRFTPS